jgi:hypothetical protein
MLSKTRTTIISLVAASGFAAAAIAPTVAQAANAAKLCQKGGWRNWLRADETPFANHAACVSYVTHGGVLATVTTSTTRHETLTRVDRPTFQTYRTRVISYMDRGTTFDQIFLSALGSSEIQAGLQNAEGALSQALRQEALGGGEVVISRPSFTTARTSTTSPAGEEIDHTQTSPTTTTTLGPAIIFVGENHSQAFIVAAGTENINTDTHTEFFVNQLYQTSAKTESTYSQTGYVIYPR